MQASTAIQEFAPERVRPLPKQPRQRFRGIPELAASMRRVGQISPGKVTLLDGVAGFDAQLVDGERRLRACTLAGIRFRAEVADAADEAGQFEISLAANFGKQDHDCVEIAHALGRLQAAGRTIKDMADICGGKSTTWIAQHLSILNLHPDVQAMLIPSDEESAKLAFTTAITLANHPHDLQIKLANKIARGNMSFVQARRLVLKESTRLGISATKEKRSPLDNFFSLHTCIENLTHRLGVFVDMPGPDLQLAVEAADVKSRYELVKKIDDLNDSLSEIADVIESTLKKRRTA